MARPYNPGRDAGPHHRAAGRRYRRGPDRVTDRAARALSSRGPAPKIRERSEAGTCASDLAVELASVEVSRIADARPEGRRPCFLQWPASPTSRRRADPGSMGMRTRSLFVVSMLFGGNSGIAAAPIRREPSPTEIVVATRVFEEIASALNKSGDRSRISRCRCRRQSAATNSGSTAFATARAFAP